MAEKDPYYKRIHPMNEKTVKRGDFVLYWMQQSQRVEYNHALGYAIEVANGKNAAVLVLFALMDDYPEANIRHYTFMLEGLRQTEMALAGIGIRLIVLRGHPADVAAKVGKDASMIVTDVGYLRHQQQWRKKVAAQCPCRMVQVESDVVVPVREVSDSHQYAARTIRPRIHRRLSEFLTVFNPPGIRKESLSLGMDGENLEDLPRLLEKLRIDRSVFPVTPFFSGGTPEAKRRFQRFLKNSLSHYDQHSNQPQTNHVSGMSPYLHFGQISPLYLAMETGKAPHLDPSGRYLEELIVRRELAMNFSFYHPDYDSYRCLPSWARRTLQEHIADRREHLYDLKRLEAAQTHDRYWNAAMREMIYTGFMHNYMRMYWGKKILEWSETPQQAFETTLYLNNKYFLDGRDPNSYANVAWIFGVHDRAWKERPIFGKIRYMAASGLERKCDIQAYVRKVDDMEQTAKRKMAQI